MKFFHSIALILFGLGLSHLAFGGSGSFIGEGRKPHAPEFIQLVATVHSECYASPAAAVNATDAVASRIFNFFKSQIDPSNGKDAVLTSGGYTRPFSRYISTSRRTICNNTFQKTTSITLKTANIKNFSSDFSEIQDLVYAQFLKPSIVQLNVGQPVTYVTLGTPVPQLYNSTRQNMEKKVLAMALENAIEKFKATMVSACEITSYRIVTFAEPSAGMSRPVAYGRSLSDETLGHSPGATAPIEFDSLWIRKSLNVKFKFEGGHCESH